jgi:hypothetical protein
MTFINELRSAAELAATAEAGFRRESAERIAKLECERAFAFRRLNLMRAVADAVARAEDEEIAVANGLGALRAKLDWSNESESQSALLSHFAPVAQALFASLKADEDSRGRGVIEALDEFEQWYATTHREPFWDLFDQPLAETPRVDF